MCKRDMIHKTASTRRDVYLRFCGSYQNRKYTSQRRQRMTEPWLWVYNMHRQFGEVQTYMVLERGMGVDRQTYKQSMPASRPTDVEIRLFDKN